MCAVMPFTCLFLAGCIAFPFEPAKIGILLSVLNTALEPKKID